MEIYKGENEISYETVPWNSFYVQFGVLSFKMCQWFSHFIVD